MRKENYKSLIVICIFLLTLFTINLFQAEKKQSKTSIINALNQEYKKWLNLVHYIITDNELEVFLKLNNNRDRNTFINLFWKIRDPSKGTPQNEYKEEHKKRYRYANKYYKYESSMPGWKTDRGRIYIILGPPVSREEIISQNGIRPLEIWEYFGGVKKGLPTAFRMVFYKKHDSGIFKQYIPIVDGPSALLRTGIGSINTANNYAVYKKLNELNPTVANISLSLIPGESLHSYSPSLNGPMLLSKVYNYPKKKINVTYAKNFLNFKGFVKTYTTSNYISTNRDIYIIKDPISRLNFIHIALRPERLSVSYLEAKEKYYLNFNLTILLKKGNDIILKYNKNYPLYYSKEELDNTISHGLVITEHFPVIPGKYKLLTILQNSLNHEISYNESVIKISNPDKEKNGYPELYKPFISYKINFHQRMIYSPFKIANIKIKIDPNRIFGLNDPLIALFGVAKGSYDKNFKIGLEIKSIDKKRKYLKKYFFKYSSQKPIMYFKKVLGKLAYGNYILKTSLIDKEGNIMKTKQNDFQVSPSSYIPHPPQVSTILKKKNSFIFYMTIARQYQNIKNYDKAYSFYKKAYKLNPIYSVLIRNYTSFLIKQKKYDEALEIVENLNMQKKEQFNYFVLKGRIFYYQHKYKKAVNTLLKANKIYNSDITLLNTLGFALIKINDIEEAIKVLSASLKINNLQKDILKIKEQLENKKK